MDISNFLNNLNEKNEKKSKDEVSANDEKLIEILQEISNDYLQEGKILTSNIKFSVCDECNEFLKNIIKENFAYITNTWCCGLEVKEVKYKEVK